MHRAVVRRIHGSLTSTRRTLRATSAHYKSVTGIGPGTRVSGPAPFPSTCHSQEKLCEVPKVNAHQPEEQRATHQSGYAAMSDEGEDPWRYSEWEPATTGTYCKERSTPDHVRDHQNKAKCSRRRPGRQERQGLPRPLPGDTPTLSIWAKPCRGWIN